VLGSLQEHHGEVPTSSRRRRALCEVHVEASVAVGDRDAAEALVGTGGRLTEAALRREMVRRNLVNNVGACRPVAFVGLARPPRWVREGAGKGCGEGGGGMETGGGEDGVGYRGEAGEGSMDLCSLSAREWVRVFGAASVYDEELLKAYREEVSRVRVDIWNSVRNRHLSETEWGVVQSAEVLAWAYVAEMQVCVFVCVCVSLSLSRSLCARACLCALACE